MEQLDEAARAFQSVLALNPTHLKARSSLGVIESLREDYVAATESLRQVVRLQPRFWKAHAILGIWLKRTGNLKAAQTSIEALSRSSPPSLVSRSKPALNW